MPFPASTKAAGQTLGIPDVCKTPSPAGPIPIPYPNTGQLNVADGVIDKVLIESKEVVVESSKLPNSQGDEAGTAGGVVSGKNMDQITFKVYSTKVIAKGKKVVYCTATTAHNGSNPNMPAGAQIVPSQTKVLLNG